MIQGKASILFETSVWIEQTASVVGQKEGDGPHGQDFDEVCMDALFGMNTWEEAEGELLRRCAKCVMDKAALCPEDIRYIFSGDLLNQTTASSYGLKSFQIPQFGLYGACSTMGEALALGAMTVGAGYADHVLCAASSHFASAEKTFRNPLDYGSQRPFSSTWTVTGAGAAILGQTSGMARITGVTTGKIMDYGIKDPMNMGAAMAPAAADTIYQALCDFGLKPSDFDRIITGDLGYVGQTALLDLLKKKGIDISEQHMDCGIEIFDTGTQDTHAGGSGCGCSASLFSSYIIKKLQNKEWRRVLFCPTGALMSQTTYHEEQTIPGICHGILLEAQ
jgi:stage V sporulation protein AD